MTALKNPTKAQVLIPYCSYQNTIFISVTRVSFEFSFQNIYLNYYSIFRNNLAKHFNFEQPYLNFWCPVIYTRHNFCVATVETCEENICEEDRFYTL